MSKQETEIKYYLQLKESEDVPKNESHEKEGRNDVVSFRGKMYRLFLCISGLQEGEAGDTILKCNTHTEGTMARVVVDEVLDVYKMSKFYFLAKSKEDIEDRNHPPMDLEEYSFLNAVADQNPKVLTELRETAGRDFEEYCILLRCLVARSFNNQSIKPVKILEATEIPPVSESA